MVVAMDKPVQINTFLMMGRPGSGKGTQAAMLAKKVGGSVYSSGSRLRDIAASGNYFGRRAKEVMSSGHLMPVWVSQYLFEDALIKLEPTDTVVFEGSCRILEEAERFHEAAEWLERQYTAVYLDVQEGEVTTRLHKRREEGRPDDNAMVMQERFERFNQFTTQSIEYFKNKGTLVTVNGNQSAEKVHRDILEALGIA
jgi:adenylate kinase